LRAASRLHLELGHERRALPRLRAVLAVTPSDAAMVFRLAQSEFRLAESAQQGDFDVQSTSAEVAREGYLRAAQAYREHVGLRPLDLAGYLGEAAARFRAAGLLGPQEIERIESERQQVEVILNHAVAVAPGSPAPHHGLGWLFEQRDDTGRARAAYEDALRLDQDYLPSILNLARLLDATGEKKSARDSCRRALLLNVNDAERRRLRQYLGQFPPPPGPARSP
jgi:tetratricopeptide (TPR) repeat protein